MFCPHVSQPRISELQTGASRCLWLFLWASGPRSSGRPSEDSWCTRPSSWSERPWWRNTSDQTSESSNELCSDWMHVESRCVYGLSVFKDTSGPFLSECPYSARLTCPAASSSSAPVAGGWSLLVQSPEQHNRKVEGNRKQTIEDSQLITGQMKWLALSCCLNGNHC